MSLDDQQRWDARYRETGPAPTPLAPRAIERSGVALPPRGRALDVACGTGAVSVWLAHHGLRVLGVDVSPVAIDAARDLADVNDVGDRVTFEVIDLDAGLPTGVFEVVVCQRFRDPVRYVELAAALAPGGVLAITVLSTVGHDGDLGPFRAEPGELVEAFGGRLEVLWSNESDGEAHLVARR